MNHVSPTWIKDITPKQRQALPLLAAGKSGKDVASAINCNPATVSQWINHDTKFQEALAAHSLPYLNLSQAQLQSFSISAVRELHNLVLNAKSESVKLKAIELILSATGLNNPGNSAIQIGHRLNKYEIDISAENYDLNQIIEALGDK